MKEYDPAGRKSALRVIGAGKYSGGRNRRGAKKRTTDMRIRKATESDFDTIMDIYAYARDFMAKTGNPNQWGPTNWPPEELIHNDIKEGNSYVCVDGEDSVRAVFYFIVGKDIEPSYDKIYDGEWKDDSEYGVVHRIAADASKKGAGSFCLEWAYEQCRHIRIDTHPDNKVMQRILERLGYTRCGIIYVTVDDYPRYAYEKTDGDVSLAEPLG